MQLVLFLLAALPACAQFRSIEISFDGIGCATCLESLPARMQRMRGIESATVDARQGILKLTLSEQNRIRLEQVRDFIEQDGTKTRRALVTVKGEITREQGKLILHPAGVPAQYEVLNATPGHAEITADATKLHPEAGLIVLTVK